jgi:hypothetical protein
MRKDVLTYPLTDGYVHHWLAAGPQAVPVKDPARFGRPPAAAEIFNAYGRPEPEIEGEPVEYGEFRAGDFQERWRYVRARHDHLVDFSAFHSAPVYLRSWACTEVDSPAQQDAAFIMTTFGAADVWIGDRHVHRQEGADGGKAPNSVRFQARLKEGPNRIRIRFEAAAVRDCPYGIALRLADFRVRPEGEDRVLRLYSQAPSPDRRKLLETLFAGCHLRQDVFRRKEQIMVYLPEGKAAVPFNIRMQTPGGQIFAEAKRDGRQKETLQPMGVPFQSPEGGYQLQFMPTPREYYEQNCRITRIREFYAATNEYSPAPYGTYAERRSECLQDAARRKDDLFAEIAKMELGLWKKVDKQVVLRAVEEVNRRSADSVLLLCGLLVMLHRYEGRDDFPAALSRPILDGIQGYRYGSDEPGGDAMDFDGESRRILFHACQTLAGQRYPEITFSCAGRSGSWHRETGGRRAREWLNARAGGGFAEWDSNTAFAEDVLALAALTSQAKDTQILELAALVLDKMLFTLGVNSFRGVFGSTHGGTRTAAVKTGYREPTSGISRLLWGMGIFNASLHGTVGLACSDYELPSILADIAADRPDELWSREQHACGDASAVNKVTHKTPDGMLCSAQDWYPGGKGRREHVWQATLSPIVTVFASHPACAYEGDGRRPDAWCGNAVLPRAAQWQDALIAVHQFPVEDWMGYTHAYFPVHGMDEHAFREGWAFGRAGDGYIALRAAQGMEFLKEGDNAYRELRSRGTPNIWLCQLGRAAREGSFDSFIEKVLAQPVEFNAASVSWTTLRGDRLSFGWREPFRVNGKEQPLGGFPHYDNPYCTCGRDAPFMDIRLGTEVMRLHFQEEPEEASDS